jgi:hypothetical protein
MPKSAELKDPIKLEYPDDEHMSRSHACFTFDTSSKTWCVRDFGSLNGTYVNSKRLSASKEASQPHVLKKGDNIDCGSQVFKVIGLSTGAGVGCGAGGNGRGAGANAGPVISGHELEALRGGGTTGNACSRFFLSESVDRYAPPLSLFFVYCPLELTVTDDSSGGPSGSIHETLFIYATEPGRSRWVGGVSMLLRLVWAASLSPLRLPFLSFRLELLN